MKTFYVATLARYVRVDAEDEAESASLGQDALHALYADLRAKHGREIPIEIKSFVLRQTQRSTFGNSTNGCFAKTEATNDQTANQNDARRWLHPHVNGSPREQLQCS